MLRIDIVNARSSRKNKRHTDTPQAPFIGILSVSKKKGGGRNILRFVAAHVINSLAQTSTGE